MNYTLLLTIHIASVLLLLGVGGGSAFYKFVADRSGDIHVIVHTNKTVVLADWLFTTPSAILQPVTGVMLMYTLHLSIWTPWLLSSIILYIFSGGLWLIAVYLQIRMRDIALDALEKDTALGEEYFKLVRVWIWLGVFSFIAMAAIFVLMIYKF